MAILYIEDMDKTVKSPSTLKAPIPTKIGPYKIESLFKVGGMSRIYLAIHPETGKRVIVKVVLPKYLKNSKVLSRLVREGKILGLTNHPGIVKLYDVGEWEEGLFVAMEFVEGVSLRSFLRRKSFTHKRALEIIIQVCYAVYHLHSHGVIHRDLKPENILITESGEIKLIDFGISYFTEQKKEERITKARVVLGTPRYMSPEQSENPKGVSFSTDIYSLGLITYELYLGRLSHGVVDYEIVPSRLRKILKRALNPDPLKRYEDILGLIDDLTGYLKTVGEEKEAGEETPEELIDLIENARATLMSKEKPQYVDLEVGIALRESIHPIYLDFFTFSQNRLGVIVATPEKNELRSILHLSTLRGMARGVALGKDEVTSFLKELEKVVESDPIQSRFSVSFLMIDVAQNLISYAGRAPLYHFRGSNPEPRLLEVLSTPLLGEGGAFEEIRENWSPGDTLLLSSAPWSGSLKKEALFLSSQPLAEKALESVNPSLSPEGSVSLISFRNI